MMLPQLLSNNLYNKLYNGNFSNESSPHPSIILLGEKIITKTKFRLHGAVLE